MLFRSTPLTLGSAILALVLFFTIPWWGLAILGAIASAFGGNPLYLILILFVGMWIITQL